MLYIISTRYELLSIMSNAHFQCLLSFNATFSVDILVFEIALVKKSDFWNEVYCMRHALQPKRIH